MSTIRERKENTYVLKSLFELQRQVESHERAITELMQSQNKNTEVDVTSINRTLAEHNMPILDEWLAGGFLPVRQKRGPEVGWLEIADLQEGDWIVHIGNLLTDHEQLHKDASFRNLKRLLAKWGRGTNSFYQA